MLVEFPSIGQAILAALRGNSFACFAVQYSGAARNTVRLSGSAGRNPEACLIAIYFFFVAVSLAGATTSDTRAPSDAPILAIVHTGWRQEMAGMLAVTGDNRG